MSSADETSKPISFESEAKFEVARFSDYPFDTLYEGPTFATSHNGISYRWKIGVRPNGGKYADVKETRDFQYFLCCAGGPLRSFEFVFYQFLKVGGAVKRQKSDNVKHTVMRFGNSLASIDDLRKDGCFSHGVATVGVRIEMSEDLFCPEKIFVPMKEELDKVWPRIVSFPRELAEKLLSEPSHGIYLKLVVGNQKQELFVMPQVLELNSEYFKRMFQINENFKEKQQGEVDFTKYDSETMLFVMFYLHGCCYSTTFLDELCIQSQVIEVAHLFELPQLLLQCDHILCEKISSENDVETAILADRYDLNLSKNRAINSLADRIDEVLGSADSVTKLKNAKIYDELFRMVAESRRCTQKYIAKSAPSTPTQRRLC